MHLFSEQKNSYDLGHHIRKVKLESHFNFLNLPFGSDLGQFYIFAGNSFLLKVVFHIVIEQYEKWRHLFVRLHCLGLLIFSIGQLIILFGTIV